MTRSTRSPIEFEPLPPARPLEESSTALAGLRLFATAFRLAWNEETLESREASDVVIKAAPVGAQLLRGFRMTEGEPDEHIPIAPIERVASMWRQRQARKARLMGYELKSLERTYLEKPPDTDPPIDDLVFDSPAQRRAELQRRKTAAMDRGKVSTLGTQEHRDRIFGVRDDNGNLTVKPARMRFKQRTAQMHDIHEHHELIEEQEELREKLARGAAGETVHGRYRRRKIEESRRKVEDLRERRDILRAVFQSS